MPYNNQVLYVNLGPYHTLYIAPTWCIILMKLGKGLFVWDEYQQSVSHVFRNKWIDDDI